MLPKIIITIASSIDVLFVLLLLVASHNCVNRTRRRNVKSQVELVPRGPFPQISYEDILGATGGLNKKNLIGAGGFGSVYKGILGNSNNAVAIKVLNLRNRAASKSFIAECGVITNYVAGLLH